MHRGMGRKLGLCALMAACTGQIRVGAPAGTGFTYQGQLKLSGAAINGSADLSFELYDAAAGGTQIGATLGWFNVTVSGGLFTVTLNAGGEFGPNAFNGQARWLQIAVRSPTQTGSFVTLSPRQPINAAPYALGPWNLSGGNLRYTGGGAVVQTAASNYGFTHTDGTRTVSTYVSPSGGWLGTTSNDPLNFFVANGNASMTIAANGKVGINTAAPNAASQLNVVTSAAGGQAVRGDSSAGNGVVGTSAAANFSATAGVNSNANGYGVFGQVGGPSNIDLSAFVKPGVWGDTSTGIGVIGSSSANSGVVGISSSGGYGVLGTTRGTGSGKIGVYGVTTGGVNSFGVFGNAGGSGSAGVYGSGPVGTLAGRFDGNVDVNGALFAQNVSSSVKQFRIDHPLDPEHKYLSHTCVESPDMKNMYDGVVTTNDQGDATVTMPDWFEALNRDFRYQLTVVGQFAQAIVAEEIHDLKFRIKTDKPNVKVSWQVTGIRHDVYAEANRAPVETDKPANEQGRYIQPELFGKSKELKIGRLASPQ